MRTPVFTDDPAANRQIWAEWLRRSDWQDVPRGQGQTQECRTPWDAGYALAREHWPSSHAIIAEDTDPLDIEDEIMAGCYGFGEEAGAFNAAELTDRLRNVVHMVARAARSAPPYPGRDAQDAKEILGDLLDTSEWSLYILSVATIDLWEYDPSPVRGAILGPTEVARLIADILDAAPPSLLTPAAEE